MNIVNDSLVSHDILDKFLRVTYLTNKTIRRGISAIYFYSLKEDSKYYIQEPKLLTFYIEDIRRLVIFEPSNNFSFKVSTYNTSLGNIEVREIKGTLTDLFRVGLPEVLMVIIRKGSVNKKMFYSELKSLTPVLPDREYYNKLKTGSVRVVFVTHDTIKHLTALIDVNNNFEIKRYSGQTFFRLHINGVENTMSIDVFFKVPNPKSRVTLNSKLVFRYRTLKRMEIPVVDILNIEAFNLSELDTVNRLVELMKVSPKEGISEVNRIIRGDWELKKLAKKYKAVIFKPEESKIEKCNTPVQAMVQTLHNLGMIYELVDLVISSRAVSIINKNHDIVYINNVGAYYFFKRYFETNYSGLDRPLANYVPKYLTQHNGTALKVRIVNYKDKTQSFASKLINPTEEKLKAFETKGYYYNRKHNAMVLKIVKPGNTLLGKDVVIIKVEGTVREGKVEYIITGLESVKSALRVADIWNIKVGKIKQ